MAVAAMTPRSLASAFMRLSLPADSFTWAIMARRLQAHRFVVARHLEIAGPARGSAVGDSALPITGARRVFRHEFLVVHSCRAFQFQVEGGDGDAPAYGIAGARFGTGPIVERLELEIFAFQVRGAPVGR